MIDISKWQPFVYWSQRRHPEEAGTCDTHGHKYCYMLWAQEEGVAVLRNGDQTWTVQPGQVALSNPGMVAEWHGTIVYSRMAFDLVACERQQDPSGRPVWAPVTWSQQPPLQEILGKDISGLLPEADAPVAHFMLNSVRTFFWRSAGEHLRCCNMVGQWFLDYCRRHATPLFTSGHPVRGNTPIDKVEMLIEDQLEARMSVAALAKQVDMSREHLSRIYKQERGIALKDAIAQFRLRRLESLLVNSVLPMAIIARRSGYRSVDGMRKAFKQHFGCLPSEYRQRSR